MEDKLPEDQQPQAQEPPMTEEIGNAGDLALAALDALHSELEGDGDFFDTSQVGRLADLNWRRQLEPATTTGSANDRPTLGVFTENVPDELDDLLLELAETFTQAVPELGDIAQPAADIPVAEAQARETQVTVKDEQPEIEIDGDAAAEDEEQEDRPVEQEAKQPAADKPLAAADEAALPVDQPSPFEEKATDPIVNSELSPTDDLQSAATADSDAAAEQQTPDPLPVAESPAVEQAQEADDHQTADRDGATTEPEVGKAEPAADVAQHANVETTSAQPTQSVDDPPADAEPAQERPAVDGAVEQSTAEPSPIAAQPTTASAQADEADDDEPANAEAEDLPQSDYLDDLIARIDAELAVRSREQEQTVALGVTPRAETSAGEQLIVFQLGEEQFAISVQNVLEVGEAPAVTWVPFVPDWVRGVFNLRGEVLSLVDLGRFLNGEPAAGRDESWLIVAQTRDGRLTVGLLVDAIVGNRHYAHDSQAALAAPLTGDSARYLDAVYQEDDLLIAALDGERLLAATEVEQ